MVADRLQEPDRGRRRQELDARGLVRPVLEAPALGRALEPRRLRVLGEHGVQRRDGVLLRGRVERLPQPFAQLLRGGDVLLAHGRRGLVVAVEAEVEAEPAHAQKLWIGLELVPRVQEVDGERDPTAAA